MEKMKQLTAILLWLLSMTTINIVSAQDFGHEYVPTEGLYVYHWNYLEHECDF